MTIDDLSDEGMSNLSQDNNFQAAIMQIGGSVMGDYQKLINDESVQQLMSLFAAMQPPVVVEEESV